MIDPPIAKSPCQKTLSPGMRAAWPPLAYYLAAWPPPPGPPGLPRAPPRPQGPWTARWNSKNEPLEPMGPHGGTHGAPWAPGVHFWSSRALPMGPGALGGPWGALGGQAVWAMRRWPMMVGQALRFVQRNIESARCLFSLDQGFYHASFLTDFVRVLFGNSVCRVSSSLHLLAYVLARRLTSFSLWLSLCA